MADGRFSRSVSGFTTHSIDISLITALHWRKHSHQRVLPVLWSHLVHDQVEWAKWRVREGWLVRLHIYLHQSEHGNHKHKQILHWLWVSQGEITLSAKLVLYGYGPSLRDIPPGPMWCADDWRDSWSGCIVSYNTKKHNEWNTVLMYTTLVSDVSHI